MTDATAPMDAIAISAVAILLFAAVFLYGARLLSCNAVSPARATHPPVTRGRILPFYRIAFIAAVFQAAFVLLLPWALGLNQLLEGDATTLSVAALCILVQVIALVYAARRRAIDWEERSPMANVDG